MAQDSQEMILGVIGALGRLTCSLDLLLDPYALTDIGSDAPQSPDCSIRVPNGKLDVHKGPLLALIFRAFIEGQGSAGLKHPAVILQEESRQFRREKIL